MRAEQRVRELTDENESKDERIGKLVADFEAMKKDLMASNAVKDQLIGELNGQINQLNSNVKEKDASIEEKLYAFEFEKRRMNDALKNSQNNEGSLRDENKTLAAQLSQTKNELDDLKFSFGREKDNRENMANELNQKNQQFEEQAAQLASLRADIQKLKIEAKDKDETIERLKNNVALLKSQIGK